MTRDPWNPIQPSKYLWVAELQENATSLSHRVRCWNKIGITDIMNPMTNRIQNKLILLTVFLDRGSSKRLTPEVLCRSRLWGVRRPEPASSALPATLALPSLPFPSPHPDAALQARLEARVQGPAHGRPQAQGRLWRGNRCGGERRENTDSDAGTAGLDANLLLQQFFKVH